MKYEVLNEPVPTVIYGWSFDEITAGADVHGMLTCPNRRESVIPLFEHSYISTIHLFTKSHRLRRTSVHYVLSVRVSVRNR